MPDENTFEPLPQGALAKPAPQQTFTSGFEPLPQGARSKPASGFEPLPGTRGANTQDAIQPLPSGSDFEPLPTGALRQPAPDSRDEQKTDDPNAPWYEKTWNWANRPLVDLHRQGAEGWEAGAEDIASSLTSPLSIALFAGTAGSGAALRALGIGAKELPLVARGAKALLSGGLTATQVAQVIQESPRVLDALKEGDYSTAKRLAVHVAAGTAFAALGGRAAFKDVYSPSGVFRPTEQNAGLREEFGKYQGDVETGNRAAQLHKEALEDSLPKGADRGSLYRYISAGGSRAKLVERYNAIAESAGREKLPAEQPVKVYHGTSADVADIGKLDSSTHGTAGFAGVGDYLTTKPADAGQYAGPADVPTGGRVVAGVLNPDTNLLDAHTPLPEALHQKLSAELGERMPKDAAYLQFINALREKTAPQDLIPAMKSLQKVLAEENYDGLRYNNGIRDAILIFPKDVIGRSLSELVRPAVPNIAQEPLDPALRDLAARKLLADAPAKYVDKILGEYQRAMNLGPEERTIANKIRQSYSEDFELAHSRGVLGNAVKDYANRIWEQPENPAARTITNAASNGRFGTNVSMARHRLFESETMGELLGHRLASSDPIELSAWNKAQIRKAVAARDFLDRVRDSNLRASDGRPMVALSGTGEPMTGDEAGSLANPFKIRNIRIADALVKQLQQSGDLQRFLDDGTVVQRKSGEYRWNAGDFKTIDHPAFRAWNYATEAPDGSPILVKGELRAHPEVFEQLKRYIPGAEQPLLGSSRVAKAISTFSGESKRLLFSLSPFHAVQEGVRSFMAGVNPFSMSNDWNIETNPILRKGVEHGLTLAPEYKSSELFSEGMSGGNSKIIGKIPLLRDINQFIHHTIFERYIPSRKAASYEVLVKQYRQAYPKWEPEKVFREAAAHTNELFGGINFRYLGRSARSQDLMRLASLSPDWTESNVRLIGRALGPTGAVARKQLAKLAVTVWLGARIANYLTSGQPHNETPFGVAIKDDSGKERVYTLRSPITDALHLAQDPRSFMLNRLSPAVKSGVEIATGRDVRGRAVTSGDTALNALSNMTPIPAQGALHYFNSEGPERDGFSQVLQSFGVENFQYRSQAEKLAGQLASNRAPSGPVDSSQLAAHLQKLRAEDDLRGGRNPDLTLFPPNERREITKNARLTPLQARFPRLPMADALQVWDASTKEEKAELSQEFIKKKNHYLRKMYTAGPEARAKDRTYRRLAQMFPASQEMAAAN
jgi:hypothetical protein